MKAKINSDFIGNIKFSRYEKDGTTYFEPKEVDNGCLVVITHVDGDVPHKKLEAYSKEDEADLDDLGIKFVGVDNLIVNDLEIIKE